MGNDNKVLELRDISLKLSGKQILDKVSIAIYENRILGLVGNNGAGKTSLLKVALGLMPRYEGSVVFQNVHIRAGVYRGIGAVMDSLEPDGRLTAPVYLRRVSDMLGVKDNSEEIESLLERVGLKGSCQKKIARFSLGMKRRLMVACSLLGSPKLLVLDEPFNGIDPEGMNELRIMLRSLAGDGISILITSHIINELIKLSDDFAVICKGRIMANISGSELKNISGSKLLIRTVNPEKVVKSIGMHLPELFCIFTSTEDVSVIGTEDVYKVRRCLEGLLQEGESIVRADMESEDWLLWKMNGYGQDVR